MPQRIPGVADPVSFGASYKVSMARYLATAPICDPKKAPVLIGVDAGGDDDIFAVVVKVFTSKLAEGFADALKTFTWPKNGSAYIAPRRNGKATMKAWQDQFLCTTLSESCDADKGPVRILAREWSAKAREGTFAEFACQADPGLSIAAVMDAHLAAEEVEKLRSGALSHRWNAECLSNDMVRLTVS